MKKHDWDSIIQQIKKSNNILLTTHVHPDGDGLGSELAIYYCLKKMGKNPVILNSSALPEEYIFLDEDKIFQKYNPKIHKYNVIELVWKDGKFVKGKKSFE